MGTNETFIVQGVQMDDRAYKASTLAGTADPILCMVFMLFVEYVMTPLCKRSKWEDSSICASPHPSFRSTAMDCMHLCMSCLSLRSCRAMLLLPWDKPSLGSDPSSSSMTNPRLPSERSLHR